MCFHDKREGLLLGLESSHQTHTCERPIGTPITGGGHMHTHHRRWTHAHTSQEVETCTHITGGGHMHTHHRRWTHAHTSQEVDTCTHITRGGHMHTHHKRWTHAHTSQEVDTCTHITRGGHMHTHTEWHASSHDCIICFFSVEWISPYINIRIEWLEVSRNPCLEMSS